jgi:DNA modification methylase
MPPPKPTCDPLIVHCKFDRIVGLDEYASHPKNNNEHPESQLRVFEKILKHQGIRRAAVVSKQTDRFIVGHGLRATLRRMGITGIPVEFQNFESEDDELRHLLADNQLGKLAKINEELTESLLAELNGFEIDLELTGFTEDQLEDFDLELDDSSGNDDAEKDAEPDIDRAAVLNELWQVRTGDVWQIGEHRLMCGSSTDELAVAQLIGGGAPRLMVTDPPYGVEYDADWRNRTNDLTRSARAVGKVQNDHIADWSEAWKLSPSEVCYIWHAGLKTGIVLSSIESAGFEPRSLIIWNKNCLVIGRGDYHHKHEPCWYGVRKGKTGGWIGDRKQTTVWDIDKPQKSETGHSTQKPVECMARPMRNNSGDVHDPFLGSGTTMVAAQNLGRKCYGMEISPSYCAVILDRMQRAFPGIEIKRLAAGSSA